MYFDNFKTRLNFEDLTSNFFSNNLHKKQYYSKTVLQQLFWSIPSSQITNVQIEDTLVTNNATIASQLMRNHKQTTESRLHFHANLILPVSASCQVH